MNTRAVSSAFLSLSLALAVACSTSLLLPSGAYAADKAVPEKKKEGPAPSPKVGKPLQAAVEAIGKKQYDVALAKIQEAEDFPKKTPFDQFQIDEIRAYVYTSQSIINPEVVALFEKSMATPEFLEPEKIALRLQAMAEWAFNKKDFAKAIEYGNRRLVIQPDSFPTLNVIALAQYNSQDYKSALATFDSAVAAKEKTGVVPDEQWLRLIPSCASQLGDDARYEAGYGKLVRYYPKPEYWEKLLGRTLDVEKSEVALLYVFRLMSEVGALNKASSYLEYADRAVENAMPNEALGVLEAGFEKKLLGVNDKEKAGQQQKLADVKRKAQADRAQLPDIEKEAANPKATTGQLRAGLGLAYFSFGMYEQAIAALDAGIKKGGLKNLDDYRMVLGIAQLRTGQKDAARASFQSIAAPSPFARVANLWAIRTYN